MSNSIEAVAESSTKAAFAKAMQLLRVRERSIAETQERLLQAGFEQVHVDEVLESLVSSGLLDDDRFAQAYLAGKRNAGWGNKRIAQGLKGFGIDLNNHEELLAELTDNDGDLERAVRELKRFITKAKNLHEARYRRLMSKGYASSIVCAAVLQLERDEEA